MDSFLRLPSEQLDSTSSPSISVDDLCGNSNLSVTSDQSDVLIDVINTGDESDSNGLRQSTSPSPRAYHANPQQHDHDHVLPYPTAEGLRVGQLFGPFMDPLIWLAVKCGTATAGDLLAVRANPFVEELFRRMDIAQRRQEQNAEIVLIGGKFYFHLINVPPAIKSKSKSKSSKSNKFPPPLKAWFDEALSGQLPRGRRMNISGSDRFVCPMCGESFVQPHPVTCHAIFTCTKRLQNLAPLNSGPVMNHNQTDRENEQSPTTTTTKAGTSPRGRKRGFDIASLVSNDADEEEQNDSQANNHKMSKILCGSSSNQLHLETESSSNVSPSAFRKVEKCSPPITHRVDLFRDSEFSPHSASPLPPTSSFDNLLSAYQSNFLSPASLSQFISQSMSPLSASFGSMPQTTTYTTPTTSDPSVLMPPPLPLGKSTPSASSSSSPSTSNSKVNAATVPLPVLPAPSPLLSFVPPSLAALSFPSTNWCAKCNASFRMTSDLVYHMRTHHKLEKKDDPVKKRLEKLKCHICGEGFRERHHLTRHALSHAE